MARKTSFDVDFHSITLVKGRREGPKWKLPNEPKRCHNGGPVASVTKFCTTQSTRRRENTPRWRSLKGKCFFGSGDWQNPGFGIHSRGKKAMESSRLGT